MLKDLRSAHCHFLCSPPSKIVFAQSGNLVESVYLQVVNILANSNAKEEQKMVQDNLGFVCEKKRSDNATATVIWEQGPSLIVIVMDAT